MFRLIFYPGAALVAFPLLTGCWTLDHEFVPFRLDGDHLTIWTRQPISGPGSPCVCESGRVTFSARPQR